MSNNDSKINIYILVLILVLVIIILSFSFGYYIAKKDIVKIDKYVFVNDTIQIRVKPKILRDTIKLKDTINNIVIIDTIYIAKIDTTFPDSLYLNISYYSPPKNYFDIKYRLPNTKNIIYIAEDKRINKFSVSVGSGLLFGTKGIDYGVYLGISYNILNF